MVETGNRQKSAEKILDNLAGICRKLAGETDGMIRGVGMAIPGPFDYEHGISRMQGLNKYDAIYGIPLEPEIRERVPELKRAAEKGEEIFPAEKYVNKIPVKKHDHVLIPAGTVHCSGKNTMVLEISATPYIFTFKLWDWGRLGMDGLPRPIHLDHGMKNIQWNRDTKWVYDNIVGQTRTLEKTENCEVERTGLHSREFIDTIRYTLSGPHTVSMDDTVHVMNLVEGRSVRIESMDGSFAPFTVHYAETAIVPAAVGTYRIVPEEGEMIKMLVASVG